MTDKYYYINNKSSVTLRKKLLIMGVLSVFTLTPASANIFENTFVKVKKYFKEDNSTNTQNSYET